MATDQEIRDAGFKYVPQQKYLLNPFKLPEDQEPVTNEGIVNTNAFVGGSSGDGFNVYNPDPNSIVNKIYRPNYDYRKFVDYNPELSDLQNQKIMQGTANFKGYDYYNKPEPTGLARLGELASNFMPGAGIARFIGDYLPVDRRSILENELAASNVRVDDIGRIVQGQGDYNTAANVMAGYNPIKMTAETFDKRIAKIQDTIDKKTKKYGSYDGKLGERIKAIEEAKQNFLNADSESYKIKEFEETEKEKKRKNNIISRIFSKKNKTTNNVDTGKGEDKGGSIIKTNNNQTDRRESDYSGSVGLGSNANNVRAAMAERAANPGSKKGSAQSYNQNLAEGGRAGYFFGGRVNYKKGGRTDAGPNRTTASKAGVGQINESGQKVSGGNFNNNNNNDGGSIKPTFYNDGVQVLTNRSELGFDYPTGLTKNFGVGQLSAILNAKKSLEEEKPEGFLQYDSSIGPVDTRFTYDTAVGPEFNANYVGDNFDIGVNNKTGLSANYTKDIGPGTFTAGGSYKPDGTYNAEGKYVISYANGGLASIL